MSAPTQKTTTREVPRNPQASYYRARYYDPNAGRFANEDPSRFGGGTNFYIYAHESPIGSTDPMGLSPADIQRIGQMCKKCTKNLTDAGMRMDGGSGEGWGFLPALIVGGINDVRSGFSTLKKQACLSQATMVKSDCFDAKPTPPYDDSWGFAVLPIWNGYHSVIRGFSRNPSDPDIICDPWLNRFYTTPKQTWPEHGGGGGKK